MQLKRMIILVGMMGAGKSAIGRSLAEALDVPFWDSDLEIEAAANATIAEVFARDGEAFFRRREAEVLRRIMAGPVGVLSTGGGAWIQSDTRADLIAGGVPVWLDADLDVLWDRVRKKATRPLLQTQDPFGTLRGLYEARRDIYALAPLRVKSMPGASVHETTARVLEALRAQPDLLEA